ncbi:flagellar hook-length control protein FliK [Pseudotabrizicola alkalilacus]|uniref:Flagellar hook-length control protein FliK n=2 Tax=Pseudotabrizicola alkalilacus TaxID=2305252 RepID=A0A411YYK8_9RHOB|nr:flagellar hook-length control protein FliK [Pseudotabrizicola alkalilacus]
MQITNATQLQLSPPSPSKQAEDNSGTFAAVVQSLGTLQPPPPSVLSSRQTAPRETPAQPQSPGDETAAFLIADTSGGDPLLGNKVAFGAAPKLPDQNQGLPPASLRSYQGHAVASLSEMPLQAPPTGLVAPPPDLNLAEASRTEPPLETGQTDTPHIAGKAPPLQNVAPTVETHADTTAALEHLSPPANAPELPALQDQPASPRQQVSGDPLVLPGLPVSPTQAGLLKAATIQPLPRSELTAAPVPFSPTDSLPPQTDAFRHPRQPASPREQTELDAAVRPDARYSPARSDLPQITLGQSQRGQEVPLATVTSAAPAAAPPPSQAKTPLPILPQAQPMPSHDTASVEPTQPSPRTPTAQPSPHATGPQPVTRPQTPVAAAGPGPAAPAESTPPQAIVPRQPLPQAQPMPSHDTASVEPTQPSPRTPTAQPSPHATGPQPVTRPQTPVAAAGPGPAAPAVNVLKPESAPQKPLPQAQPMPSHETASVEPTQTSPRTPTAQPSPHATGPQPVTRPQNPVAAAGPGPAAPAESIPPQAIASRQPLPQAQPMPSHETASVEPTQPSPRTPAQPSPHATGPQPVTRPQTPVAAAGPGPAAPAESTPPQAIASRQPLPKAQLETPHQTTPRTTPAHLATAIKPAASQPGSVAPASTAPTATAGSVPPQADTPRHPLPHTHTTPLDQVERDGAHPAAPRFVPERNVSAQNAAQPDLLSARVTVEGPRYTATALFASPRHSTASPPPSSPLPEIALISRILHTLPSAVVQANATPTSTAHVPGTPLRDSDAEALPKAGSDRHKAAPFAQSAQFNDIPAKSNQISAPAMLKANANGMPAPTSTSAPVQTTAATVQEGGQKPASPQPVAVPLGQTRTADMPVTSAQHRTNPAIPPLQRASPPPQFLDASSRAAPEMRGIDMTPFAVDRTIAPDSGTKREPVKAGSVAPVEKSAQSLTTTPPADKNASIRSEPAAVWQAPPLQNAPVPTHTGQQAHFYATPAVLPRQDQGSRPHRISQETSTAVMNAPQVQATTIPYALMSAGSAPPPPDHKSAQAPTAPLHGQGLMPVAEPDSQPAVGHTAPPPATTELPRRDTRSPSKTGPAGATDIRTTPPIPARYAAASDASLANTDMLSLNREGAVQSLSAPFTSSTPTAGTGPPHVTQQVAQSIIQSLKMGGDGPMALTLRPEELGQLRFEISTTGDRLAVILFVERPEAMELIRRHGDQLLSDLRLSGFNQPTLSFGDWAQRDGRTGTPSGPPPASTAPIAEGDSPSIIAPPQHFTATGRLDIRL